MLLRRFTPADVHDDRAIGRIFVDPLRVHLAKDCFGHGFATEAARTLAERLHLDRALPRGFRAAGEPASRARRAKSVVKKRHWTRSTMTSVNHVTVGGIVHIRVEGGDDDRQFSESSDLADFIDGEVDHLVSINVPRWAWRQIRTAALAELRKKS